MATSDVKRPFGVTLAESSFVWHAWVSHPEDDGVLHEFPELEVSVMLPLPDGIWVGPRK